MQGHGSGRKAAFRFRAAGFVLLAAHLSYVCWAILRPLDVPYVTPVSLKPLSSIRADLELGPREAVRSMGRELLLLAPLGVLLPLAAGRVAARRLTSLARTVFTGAMISLTVEVLDSRATGQVVNIDTVLLNTAGVALAHLAVVPAVRGWLRRRADRREPAALPRDEEPRPVTPRISRVAIAPWSDALSGARPYR
ncbi:VanZ family protein [Streptomyces sp. SAJ15]|uniref:VanZ family protein n=1 Tax=Streptomyces sp. SAJ15 TaxID=2011095 RepID=UPI001185F0BF|nr:VanZ family protein [Streptomyces sp. SAJ15]TVL90194.1 hypothetical protein CD790_24005 [Streptomyces sp. SAJ15]